MSWLKPQPVDGSTACYTIGAIICPLPRVLLRLGSLVRPSFLMADQAAWNSVPFRSMACMMMARRPASSIRALRMLDLLAMANAQPDAKDDSQTAVLVLKVDALSGELLPCNDRRPNSVRRQRLDMHRLEEAGPRQMRQAACIIAIGLVRRERPQRLICLPLSVQTIGKPSSARPW